MTYVLMWVIIYNGVSTGSHEFLNKDACDAARVKFESSMRATRYSGTEARIGLICQEKGKKK